VPLNDGNTVEDLNAGRRGVRKVRAWCRDRGVVTEAARKEVREGTTLVADCREQDAGRPDRGRDGTDHEEAGEEYSKCSKDIESSQISLQVVES